MNERRVGSEIIKRPLNIAFLKLPDRQSQPGKPRRIGLGQHRRSARSQRADAPFPFVRAIETHRRVIVIRQIHHPPQGQLLLIAEAGGHGGLLFRLGQRRQQHGGEDGNDGDHDEQFDEGETRCPAASGCGGNDGEGFHNLMTNCSKSLPLRQSAAAGNGINQG